MDNKIKERLNRLNLRGCEKILIGDMMHYAKIDEPTFKTVSKQVLYLLKYLFFERCEFFVSEEPTILCVFFSVKRKDHEKAYDNVVELLEKKVVLKPLKKRVVFSHIKYAPYLLSWNTDLKKQGFLWFERLQYINYLFESFLGYKSYEKEKNKNNWEIDALLTFCDVHIKENFFVQMFNLQGKRTITLQHGAFSLAVDSWAYYGSKSDYFLMDSPHSVDCAKMVNYSNKAIPVGSMYCINDPMVEEPISFKNTIIGVVMNSKMAPMQDNIEMLKTVQDYCKKRHKKAYIKYHPGNNPEDYKRFLDFDVVKECERTMTISEFLTCVDIIVVNDSTVFSTALLNWIPAFLFFREEYDNKKYLNSEKVKFNSEEGLDELIEKINSLEFRETITGYRNYYLTPGNISENYKNAFRKIGINNVK